MRPSPQTAIKLMVWLIQLFTAIPICWAARGVNQDIMAYLNAHRTPGRRGTHVCACYTASQDGPYGNCKVDPHIITTCPDDTCTFVTATINGARRTLKYCGDERQSTDCYKEFKYGHTWETCYCTGERCNQNQGCRCHAQPINNSSLPTTTSTTMVTTMSTKSSTSTTTMSSTKSSTSMTTIRATSRHKPIFTPPLGWYPSPQTLPPYSTPHKRSPPPTMMTVWSGSERVSLSRHSWAIVAAILYGIYM